MSEPIAAKWRPKKKHLSVLERIFAAEIDNKLPWQGRQSAALAELYAADMIQPMRSTILGGPFGGITIDGWYLTHAGRYAYCSTCDAADDGREG